MSSEATEPAPKRIVGRLRSRAASFPFPGLFLGVIFLSLSLTPSLLPRSGTLQGVLSGITAAVGYGIGVGLITLWRYLGLPEPRPRGKRVARVAGSVGLAVVLGWFLMEAVTWQNNLRAIFGMEPVSHVGYRLTTLAVALLVWVLLVAIGRLSVRFVRWFMRRLESVLPPRVGRVLGLGLGVMLIIGLVNGVILDVAVRGLNNVFSVENSVTDAGVTRTTSSLRSGGPGSSVPWDSLGRQGRKWISLGPTAEEIDRFSGGGALEPIRVYVGVSSADTIEERAQLVLDELIRTGAFERDVLVLATTTGSGGIDPNGTSSLEYILNGNTATAGVQYSFLPSPLSYFVDQGIAEETATTTFNTIHDYWRTLDPQSRPRFYLFGVSLGSFASEASSTTIRVVDAPIAGALWAGPTFMNEQWVSITANRDAGSPAWLPIFEDGIVVRFTGRVDALGVPTGEWRTARYVYVQHPSDPVSFFSPSLLLHEPAWLQGARSPDMSPDMRWYPFVTFWQVLLDLPMGGSVPPGYGHNFGSASYVDAWAAMTQPPGWTDAKAEALKTLLPAGAE